MTQEQGRRVWLRATCDMYRLDVPSRLKAGAPRWLAEIACAIASVASIALARRIIDNFLPGVAPFALLYPGALMATALAGWRAGLLALFMIEYLVWRYLLAPAGFSFQHPNDVATLVLNSGAALLVIAVAETGRLASRLALKERSAKLANRELLFRELDHRVKNTFAMIASLIELQRRRSSDPPVDAALAELAQRVEYIARAHNYLYRHSEEVEKIDLCAYLNDVCQNLDQSLFADGRVRLDFNGERTLIVRDRAVALGLIVHELVTNAAKYAFNGSKSGAIDVALRRNGKGMQLTVSDDGHGLPDDFERRPGLGRRLVDGFAKQAGASLRVDRTKGATFVLEFK